MKKLGVVVGHSRIDKGAYSPHLKSSEYDWNLDLASRILGVTDGCFLAQIFLRDGVGIRGAYAAGDLWGADAFVELHFNSSHNSTSTGTGVLYQTSKSKPLAIELHRQLQLVLNLNPWPAGSGGVCTPFQASGAQERGKSALTASAKPSALIEPFFGSSPLDSKVAAESKQAMAIAIVQAVSMFFGIGAQPHD
jgi:N-acetylmuramoyl-L-alanine amidase